MEQISNNEKTIRARIYSCLDDLNFEAVDAIRTETKLSHKDFTKYAKGIVISMIAEGDYATAKTIRGHYNLNMFWRLSKYVKKLISTQDFGELDEIVSRHIVSEKSRGIELNLALDAAIVRNNRRLIKAIGDTYQIKNSQELADILSHMDYLSGECFDDGMVVDIGERNYEEDFRGWWNYRIERGQIVH